MVGDSPLGKVLMCHSLVCVFCHLWAICTVVGGSGQGVCKVEHCPVGATVSSVCV